MSASLCKVQHGALSRITYNLVGGARLVQHFSRRPAAGMKVILLTKPDDRGDRAEATIRAIFANSSFVIEVLRIEFGKKKPLEHDFQCDWLISYVCPWVIPQRVLQQARHNVNFHPGPPDYPGTGCYNFALYNGETQYGVTAHEMKPKVDSGTIYAVRRFPILPDDSVDTLQDRADGIMFGLFEETLRKIAGGTNPVAADPPEQWHPTKKATTSKDLDRLRVIPLDADDYEVARRARAMAHRRYPTGGACVELHGCRFYIPFEDAMRCDAKHVAHMDPNKAHEPRHRRIQPVHNLGEKKISPFEIEEAMMRISWQESDTWVVERSSDRLVIRPASSAAPESLSTVDTVLDAVLGAIAATNRSSPDPDTPIFAQGINSANLVRLMSELQELAGAGVTLNPALLLADPMTPRKLAQLLLSGSGSATTPPSTSLQVMLQDVRAAQSELLEAITSSRAVGVLHQDSAAAAAAHAPPPPKYAIIGGGGHASEVIMEIRREGRCEVVGVFDDNPASHGTLLEGVKVVGDSASVPADADVLICIGQNEVRKRIAEKLPERADRGAPYWPRGECIVAESASVGAGTFIAHGCYIGPRAKVGKHCIINAFANIGHDAVVEDYAFVGGGAMLAGFSEIGEGAILGMGAIVAPKVRVGPWSTVMINSAVVADVPASTACGGVPGVSFGPTERTNPGSRNSFYADASAR